MEYLHPQNIVGCCFFPLVVTEVRGSCISLALPKNHECQSTHKYPGKSSDFRLEVGFILDSITCMPFCTLPSIEPQLCTYVSNPRTQEAVAGGLPQVQRQPELLNETLPQRTKKSNSRDQQPGKEGQ